MNEPTTPRSSFFPRLLNSSSPSPSRPINSHYYNSSNKQDTPQKPQYIDAKTTPLSTSSIFAYNTPTTKAKIEGGNQAGIAGSSYSPLIKKIQVNQSQKAFQMNANEVKIVNHWSDVIQQKKSSKQPLQFIDRITEQALFSAGELSISFIASPIATTVSASAGTPHTPSALAGTTATLTTTPFTTASGFATNTTTPKENKNPSPLKITTTTTPKTRYLTNNLNYQPCQSPTNHLQPHRQSQQYNQISPSKKLLQSLESSPTTITAYQRNSRLNINDSPLKSSMLLQRSIDQIAKGTITSTMQTSSLMEAATTGTPTSQQTPIKQFDAMNFTSEFLNRIKYIKSEELVWHIDSGKRASTRLPQNSFKLITLACAHEESPVTIRIRIPILNTLHFFIGTTEDQCWSQYEQHFCIFDKPIAFHFPKGTHTLHVSLFNVSLTCPIEFFYEFATSKESKERQKTTLKKQQQQQHSSDQNKIQTGIITNGVNSSNTSRPTTTSNDSRGTHTPSLFYDPTLVKTKLLPIEIQKAQIMPSLVDESFSPGMKSVQKKIRSASPTEAVEAVEEVQDYVQLNKERVGFEGYKQSEYRRIQERAKETDVKTIRCQNKKTMLAQHQHNQIILNILQKQEKLAETNNVNRIHYEARILLKEFYQRWTFVILLAITLDKTRLWIEETVSQHKREQRMKKRLLQLFQQFRSRLCSIPKTQRHIIKGRMCCVFACYTLRVQSKLKAQSMVSDFLQDFLNRSELQELMYAKFLLHQRAVKTVRRCLDERIVIKSILGIQFEIALLSLIHTERKLVESQDLPFRVLEHLVGKFQERKHEIVLNVYYGRRRLFLSQLKQFHKNLSHLDYVNHTQKFKSNPILPLPAPPCSFN